MKLKIAYDYNAFVSLKHGGIPRYFAEIASRLSRSDAFDVRLFALGYLADVVGQALEGKYVVGFRRPKLRRTTKLTVALNSIAFPIWVRAFAPQIVHETYYAPLREAPRRSRSVLTVYDFILEKYPATFPGHLVHRLLENKSRAIRRADHIICISENTKNDLHERFDIPEERVSVIHLGYSLRIEGDRPLDQDLPEPIRRPYILYVGTRGFWKNFERLVRAYASSEELKRDFTLVCFGYSRFTQIERNLISEVGLDDSRIIQLGGDDATLASLYRHAACLVYPSVYEGFGLPPLEAMSYDCPVVCSNSSSIPEVAGDAAEYFDPYDVDAIRDAMGRVVYSAQRSETLVLRGRERIRHFSWGKCAEQTGWVYQSLL